MIFCLSMSVVWVVRIPIGGRDTWAYSWLHLNFLHSEVVEVLKHWSSNLAFLHMSHLVKLSLPSVFYFDGWSINGFKHLCTFLSRCIVEKPKTFVFELLSKDVEISYTWHIKFLETFAYLPTGLIFIVNDLLVHSMIALLLWWLSFLCYASILVQTKTQDVVRFFLCCKLVSCLVKVCPINMSVEEGTHSLNICALAFNGPKI